MGKPKVLLVGECANPHSQVAERLACWDADCEFANCYAEARDLLKQRTFELVISGARLVDGSVWQIILLLQGSPATFFWSHSVEDSCLWVKLVERGKVCWGAPPLRPREFGHFLRRILKVGSAVSGARIPEG